MSGQKTTNLEDLELEIRQGQLQRSSPGVIRPFFVRAVEQDVAAAVSQKHQMEQPANINLWVVHYTSIPAVLSMLKAAEGYLTDENPEQTDRGYLRMYSTIGSNDPGEGLYLDRFLPDEMPGGNAGNDVTSPGSQQKIHRYAYVASFITPDSQERVCKAGDNLVFWRFYGREGAGCSLQVQIPRDKLQKVAYGQETAQDSAAQLAGRIAHLEAVAKRIEYETRISPESLHKMIEFATERIRYLYKSSAYSSEQECRIVETPATALEKGIAPRFEYSGPQGQEMTKRYMNHPDLAISKILVSGSVIRLGPRVPNVADAKEHIEQLLANAGLALRTKVIPSGIEYRNPANH